MNNLFRNYAKSFDELRDLEQDEVPRSLRLFNIRVRLALDIEIDFNNSFSFTKTKTVRDTYALLLQLMEAWNAYEALTHYVKEVSPNLLQNTVKSRVYKKSSIESACGAEYFECSLAWLRSESHMSTSFNKDFHNYLERIIEAEKLGKSIKKDAKSLQDYLNNGKLISGVELLSLIYAERNMYYHNGETAKMGMTYFNRKKLLCKYKELLFSFMFQMANFVINQQIEFSR